jgi:peptidoglycan/LPS O-acetylase OafA/YrhL
VHRFFFMNRALAFFGFISYSLYLYHVLIVRIATSPKLTMELDRWRHPHLTSFVMVTCGVGICTLLAWISRVTLERAALARKGIFG